MEMPSHAAPKAKELFVQVDGPDPSPDIPVPHPTSVTAPNPETVSRSGSNHNSFTTSVTDEKGSLLSLGQFVNLF